jgi:hypothetical protein
LNVLFVAAKVDMPYYDPWPADWYNRILERILYDPSPETGLDLSLRTYIATVSSGMAVLSATVYPDLVEVTGCGAGAAIKATPTSHLYDVVCVVYPGGNHHCGGMAILRGAVGPFPGFDPPRTPNHLLGWCRFRIEAPLGVWTMELLHAATGFGDLYLTDSHPRRFDVMACSCGTHPSAFTKEKLGWLPSGFRVLRVDDPPLTLHAVGLPQPPPPGRHAALMIPTGRHDRYYLVEARLRTDAYERESEASWGIPSEGVIVYEVDESVWAPAKLLTPTALGLGDAYRDLAEGLSIRVTDAVPGGLTVEVGSCYMIRLGVEASRRTLENQQRYLATGIDDPADALGAIHREIATLERLFDQGEILGCVLPPVLVETYGAADEHLQSPIIERRATSD